MCQMCPGFEIWRKRSFRGGCTKKEIYIFAYINFRSRWRLEFLFLKAKVIAENYLAQWLRRTEKYSYSNFFKAYV